MSRFGILCPQCRKVIAYQHKDGEKRIPVGMETRILADRRIKVICPCGHGTILMDRANTQAA